MSSTIYEIASFLAAAPQSLGVLSTSLYLGTMPDTPHICGAVYEYGGLAPDRAFGLAGIKFETAAIQVVFRGAPDNYDGPRSKAETAYRALSAILPDTLLNGTKYLRINPQRPPGVIDKDTSRRFYIACSFLVWKELSV